MPDLLDRLTSAPADRYRVDREIDRGGMARVLLAHDLKLDRPVALEVFRPDLAAVLGGERFLREITLAANLEPRHPWHLRPRPGATGSTGTRAMRDLDRWTTTRGSTFGELDSTGNRPKRTKTSRT